MESMSQQQIDEYKQRQAEKDRQIRDLEARLAQLEHTVSVLTRQIRQLTPTRVPGHPRWQHY